MNKAKPCCAFISINLPLAIYMLMNSSVFMQNRGDKKKKQCANLGEFSCRSCVWALINCFSLQHTLDYVKSMQCQMNIWISKTRKKGNSSWKKHCSRPNLFYLLFTAAECCTVTSLCFALVFFNYLITCSIRLYAYSVSSF